MSKKKSASSAQPNSSPAEKKMQRKANETAREQFAALGFFIQNFEDIVSVLRNHCRDMTMGYKRGVVVDLSQGHLHLAHYKICSLVFHHEVITARPLLDLWRAILFEQCKAMPTLSKRGNQVVAGIVHEIAKDFSKLTDTRNRLIHAGWAIGRWIPSDDFSRLRVEKYKVGKEGFQKREDLPKTFDELLEHGKDASRLLGRLGRFLQFFIYQPDRIETVFKQVDKKWVFVPPI